MKKFLAIIMAVVMTLSLSAVALADENTTVKLTIKKPTSTVSENLTPAQLYFVEWDKSDGVYEVPASATLTDYEWDSVNLRWKMKDNVEPTTTQGGQFTTVPKIAVDVWNTSSPGAANVINATLSCTTNNWAPYMTADSLGADESDSQTINPVASGDIGGTGGKASDNSNKGTMELNPSWDQSKLTSAALSASDDIVVENTFTVTITYAGGNPDPVPDPVPTHSGGSN